MPYSIDDTIVALASAPGGAVRGVVRVSGPDTLACLLACFRPESPAIDLQSLVLPRVVPGSFDLGAPLGPLPCDLFFWPTARSYTRQISAELHTIGSPPLLDAAVQALCRHGARMAEPGEFTLRAFLAGRLDLTQAEAVLGVVDARDAQSLDVALAQLAGGLASPLGNLRCELLDLLADLEAGLDFADEDIAFLGDRDAADRLAHAQQSLDTVLRQISQRGTATRELRVVLRGWSNVGKSSLINALSDGDVAIVSDVAGTTRDYVSRQFSWNGLQGVLIDTAGVDDPDPHDAIGSQAQLLADAQRQQADLELLCLDASRELNSWELAELNDTSCAARLIVWTKVDLGYATQRPASHNEAFTSSRTGSGIDPLRSRICELLVTAAAPPTLVVASTAGRCHSSLEAAIQHLNAARSLLLSSGGHELVAFELREALDQIGRVVGAVYTDDILDRVFQRFCIGK